MDLGLLTLVTCCLIGGFGFGYILAMAKAIKHFHEQIDHLGRCIYVGEYLYFAKRISR